MPFLYVCSITWAWPYIVAAQFYILFMYFTLVVHIVTPALQCDITQCSTPHVGMAHYKSSCMQLQLSLRMYVMYIHKHAISYTFVRLCCTVDQ